MAVIEILLEEVVEPLLESLLDLLSNIFCGYTYAL